MRQQNEVQNDIIGIIGAKGEGKSYLCKQLYRNAERAAVCDTKAEYASGYITSSREELAKYMQREKFHIIFRPNDEEDFDFFCRCVYAAGKIFAVIEEIDFWCSANYSPPGLNKIVQYGRTQLVDPAYTTRRFPEISRSLTGQTDWFVLFRISEPRDLEGLAKRFGKSIAGKVSRLRNHASIRINVKEFRPNDDSDFSGDGAGSGVFHSEPAAKNSGGSPGGDSKQ